MLKKTRLGYGRLEFPYERWVDCRYKLMNRGGAAFPSV